MKFIFITFYLLIWNNCTGNFTTDKQFNVVFQNMEFFFTETLREYYGDISDTSLFTKFTNDYYVNRGECFLKIKRNKLISINKELFKDSVYHYFYPEVYFVQKKDSIPIVANRLKLMGKKNFSIHFRQEKNGKSGEVYKFSTEYNIYGFAKDYVFNNTDSDVLRKIKELQKHKERSQNVFELIDVLKTNPSEIGIQEVKFYIILVFWRQLCSCENIDLYGRNINKTK